MMGDNLFGACSNLTTSEGELLSEEKCKKFKENLLLFIARIDKIVYFYIFKLWKKMQLN